MDKCVGYTKNQAYICLEDLEHSNTFNSFESVVLDYCGIEQCASGHSFGPYTRKNYVIHIILSGQGIYRSKAGNFTLKAGQAFLIKPHEETLYQADLSKPWQYCWLGFHGYRSEEFLSAMGFEDQYPVIAVPDHAKINEIMNQMLDASSLCSSDELFRMSGLLSILGILIKANATGHQPVEKKNSLYVKFAIDYMRRNYQQKLKISDLADEIGITRSYLTQAFKAVTHMPPQDFLMNLRMENAAYLLTRSNMTVSEVARRSGYDDALTFSKSFRKRYQSSPSEYRQKGSYLLCEKEKGEYKNTVPL